MPTVEIVVLLGTFYLSLWLFHRYEMRRGGSVSWVPDPSPSGSGRSRPVLPQRFSRAGQVEQTPAGTTTSSEAVTP
jgi:hypothetical protein